MSDWQRVAAQRDGVIRRGEAGLTRKAAAAGVRAGSLTRYGRYTLVAALGARTREQELWAALTEVGSPALVSGATALWLYGIPVAALPDRTELLIPRRRANRRVQGATVRRVVGRELARSRTARGFPVTSVPVAVRRAGAELAPPELTEAVEHVLRLRLCTAGQLHRALGHGLVGADALRSALAVTDPASHSVWERRLASLIRRAGLPRPRRQALVGTEPAYWVDFLFDRWRLAVEVDGFAVHARPDSFVYGLRRRRRLRIRDGLDVLSYAPAEIRDRGEAVIAEIAALLAARGAPIPPALRATP